MSEIITQNKTKLDDVEMLPDDADLTYEERLAIFKEQFAQASKDLVDADEWYRTGRITWAEHKRLHERYKELFWDVEILRWKILLEKQYGPDRARQVQP